MVGRVNTSLQSRMSRDVISYKEFDGLILKFPVANDNWMLFLMFVCTTCRG